MGAPKVVDTSKSQALVETKKLAAQKTADAFEDSLYEKQTDLTNQGLDATLSIGKKQADIGEVNVNQLKDETRILNSFFDSVGTLNEERRLRNTASLSNLDALFAPVSPPINANFETLRKFLGGVE